MVTLAPVPARKPMPSMADPEPSVPRRRGRPQDPAVGAAIRSAVLRVLEEVGYRGLTMDAVAAAAGVSKASIYRRWPSKAELLMSVIDAESDRTLVSGDRGSLREDLIAHLTSLVEILAGPGGGASRALFGALDDEPALVTAYREGPMARWAQAYWSAFERAAARGEIAAGLARSFAAESGPGILMQRWLIGQTPIDRELVTRVVDEVMLPLLKVVPATGE